MKMGAQMLTSEHKSKKYNGLRSAEIDGPAGPLRSGTNSAGSCRLKYRPRNRQWTSSVLRSDGLRILQIDRRPHSHDRRQHDADDEALVVDVAKAAAHELPHHDQADRRAAPGRSPR